MEIREQRATVSSIILCDGCVARIGVVVAFGADCEFVLLRVVLLQKIV